MAKIKMPKSNPSLDMTPMVDLAFLLVTFFMLTATSRVNEPVVVDTPSSVSDKLLPENVMLISIDEKGRAFYNINNAEVRIGTLDRMGKQYKIQFTDEEKKRFSGMTSFGVPMSQLKEYINMDNDKQALVKSPGIPHDSLDNQLKDWIMFGRIEAATQATQEKAQAEQLGRDFKYEPLRFAIKADGKTNYISVKDIIQIFTDMDIYRFNLITSLEDAPTDK
jgi:biopolymer transport protein ExbD